MLALLIVPFFGYAEVARVSIPKLIIFHSPTCHKCAQIKNDLMPAIEEEFKGGLEIEYRDITDIENYKLMLGLEERHGAKIKNILPVFYFEGRFLNSEGEVKNSLKQLIEQMLNAPAIKRQDLPTIDLIERFKAFRPLAIVSAGLVDGINPCAFTVIVFFISFLALQGYRKRELIVLGLSFIFAVFLTYLLVGLGLFVFLYELSGFWLLLRIFNFSVGVFSIILGIFCLYDIFKFKKTGKTEGLVLQLPKGIKNQIHKVIGLHYRLDKSERAQGQVFKKHIFNLFLTALTTGFLVSILEAVCTGQMYLPTIAFVLKTTHLKLRALGYLLLYNLMFIIPLVIIFLLALWGVSSEQFASALKKHLVAVKIFMAILFFGLGAFLLWMV